MFHADLSNLDAHLLDMESELAANNQGWYVIPGLLDKKGDVMSLLVELNHRQVLFCWDIDTAESEDIAFGIEKLRDNVHPGVSSFLVRKKPFLRRLKNMMENKRFTVVVNPEKKMLEIQ